MTGKDPDPRLRFRIWTAGHLVAEQWLDVLVIAERGSDGLGLAHARIAMEASKAGQPWLVEIYDPEMPEDQAYLRFGTDTAGMTQPRPVGEGESLAAAVLGVRGEPVEHVLFVDE